MRASSFCTRCSHFSRFTNQNHQNDRNEESDSFHSKFDSNANEKDLSQNNHSNQSSWQNVRSEYKIQTIRIIEISLIVLLIYGYKYSVQID